MNIVDRAVHAIATRWGVTEGQVYTAIIGLAVALAAAIGGIAPTLADRPGASDQQPSAPLPRPATAFESPVR